MMIFMVKNHHIGNTLVNFNSNNGAINIFDVIISSKISYRQHTARSEACMLHNQNICGLRRKINSVILNFYIHTPHILFF